MSQINVKIKDTRKINKLHIKHILTVLYFIIFCIICLYLDSYFSRNPIQKTKVDNGDTIKRIEVILFIYEKYF